MPTFFILSCRDIMGENYFFLILYYFLEPLFPLYNVENKKAKEIGLSRDGWRDEVEIYSESRQNLTS